MKYILLVLSIIVCNLLSAQSLDDYRNYLIKYEGYKHTPYVLRGNWAVGIGHLIKEGESISLYYTDKEIELLFERDYYEIMGACALNYPNFDSLPQNIKLLLFSLVYNVGPNRIKKFIKFNTAINEKNWKKASTELKNSQYYYQVTRRAADYIKILENE